VDVRGILSPLVLVAVPSLGSDAILRDDFEAASSCTFDPDRAWMQTIDVGYGLLPGRLTVDTTIFTTIFGRDSIDDPPIAFPGISGTGPVLEWDTAGEFYAARFHTVKDVHDAGVISLQSFRSRGCFNRNGLPGPCGQPYFDLSISATCGDFGPTAKYLTISAHSDDELGISWTQRIYPNDLESDTDYYLNIRFHDPADSWSTVYMMWYANIPFP
jgi:hypothetical protein